MVAAGRAAGVRVGALVTDMSQPLGRAVGNALEVREALETLSGGGPPDLAALCRELGARMLLLGGLAPDLAAARARYDGVIASGAARARFADIVRCQGGDPAAVERPERLPSSRVVREASADRTGVVLSIDTRAVGEAALRLGAGRAKPGDAVDPAAGFVLAARIGDRRRAGDPLGTVHGPSEARVAEAAARLAAAFRIGDGDFAPPPLVYEEIV
jgi:thymidine phosphorylase